MKYIEVTEKDLQQVKVLANLIAQAEFDLKGDAIPMAYKSILWVVELGQRLQKAQNLPEPTPTQPVVKKGKSNGKL
jgi:hypothetical protein